MKSIKINNLEKENISKKEMNAILGGRYCRCGCHGPSSDFDNAQANYNGGSDGLKSPQFSVDDIIIIDSPNGPEFF